MAVTLAPEKLLLQHSDWVVRLARFGYAVKGMIYVLVGLLALRAAIGSRGSAAGAGETLNEIQSAPFGSIALAVVACGLLGYAMWRFVQAWIDPEHRGRDAKGIAIRLGYAISGVIHTGLAIEATRMFLGGLRNSGDSADHWTRELMAQPFGRWLVMLTGGVILAVGFQQCWRAWKQTFRRQLKEHEMSETARMWAIRAGRLGYAARGVVYFIIGGCLLLAGWRANPDDAVGMKEGLETLLRQPYGPWLLGVVAIGLAGYGVFSGLVLSRFRRILHD
jgi:hypothetical protein